MCVEVPVETPAVNMYYLNDIEQILHWRYVHILVYWECAHVCVHAMCISLAHMDRWL